MLSLLLTLSVPIIGTALIAALCALGLHYLTRRDLLAALLGGMVVPSLVIAGVIYWLATMDVDDAPPGMVLMGNLVVLLVVSPVSFLASFAAVRTRKRRMPSTGEV